MENLNEELLAVWLKLSSVVNNERIVSTIPYNEAHVCNLLYRQRQESPDTYLTATDLCGKTRILKSQMNKVLASLERRGMIERFPAKDDRRKAYIRLREENLGQFEAVHARSIALVDQAIARLGEEAAVQALDLLNRIADYVDESLTDPKQSGRGHSLPR